jgi:hypothetical protein
MELECKKIAFGSKTDRLIYAAGAGFGSFMGLVISVLFFKGILNK